MPKFRADFDVASTAVLDEGQRPPMLRSVEPEIEIVLRNAKPDGTGHVPRLEASVIGQSPSIDDVAKNFRAFLAKQLDVLVRVRAVAAVSARQPASTPRDFPVGG